MEKCLSLLFLVKIFLMISHSDYILAFESSLAAVCQRPMTRLSITCPFLRQKFSKSVRL